MTSSNCTQNTIGLFGKIPTHGDFVERDLPRTFLSPWDEWLQQGISSSKELLGKEWLEIYLTSPVWRFVASAGAIDDSIWAGILVPSVDNVGRYFPLTIAARISTQVNLFHFLSNNNDWYSALTNSALSALQTPFNVDQLVVSLKSANEKSLIKQISPSFKGLTQNTAIGFYQNNICESFCHMLQEHWMTSFSSFSLWNCAGSQRMPPSSLAVSGLPNGKQFTGFLVGDWTQWGS